LFLSSFGDELTWLAGSSVELFTHEWLRGALLVELAGAASPASHPVELRAALRLAARSWLLGDFSLDLGGGAGLDPEPQAPAWRFTAIGRWRFTAH
jgi:hypothetical protein